MLKKVNIEEQMFDIDPISPEESTERTFGGTSDIDRAPNAPTTIYMVEDMVQEYVIASLTPTSGDFSYNHEGTGDNNGSKTKA